MFGAGPPGGPRPEPVRRGRRGSARPRRGESRDRRGSVRDRGGELDGAGGRHRGGHWSPPARDGRGARRWLRCSATAEVVACGWSPRRPRGQRRVARVSPRRPGVEPRRSPARRRTGRRGPCWPARPRPGCVPAARAPPTSAGALARCRIASANRPWSLASLTRQRPLSCSTMSFESSRRSTSRAPSDAASRRASTRPAYSATLLVRMPRSRATTATGRGVRLEGVRPARVDEHGPRRGRARVAARRAVGADDQPLVLPARQPGLVGIRELDPSTGRSGPALHDGRRDLEDGPGDVDASRAGVGAVEDRPAAPHAVRVGQDLQPLVGPGVAGVEDEPVGVHDGSRPDVAVLGPEAGAGAGAGGAQDALGGVVVALAGPPATGAARARASAPSSIWKGITLRYLAKKSSMSTTRSLMTLRPGSGATEIFLPSWSTRILQASRLRPLMSIASEPHTPWAQERRKVSVPSWSHFTVCSRSSSGAVGSDSTVYSSQCGFGSRSGS